MIEERISHAKQSSDLTYRSITNPTKAHDSDVLAALGVADAVVMAATTAAGESGAVYVRDLIKRLQGFLANQRGISAYGVAHQVVSEVIIERCQHETETGRCVNGAWVASGEWNGQPANGWPDCPICHGSGRAAIDKRRRAISAGFLDGSSDVALDRIYDAAHNWIAHRLMDEGWKVSRLLK
jgi:hypothetical protein